MKLDTPLDVKGPYNVRGTVDVYFSNGQWLARSWPKRPKQPNSQSQISVREKFKAMLALRASLSTWEQRLWTRALWPPDKTWDDVFRSSVLKDMHATGNTSWSRPLQTAPWYSACIHWPDSWWGDVFWCGILTYRPNFNFMQYAHWIWDLADPLGATINWDVNGMLCYAGKKMIPHYYPSAPAGKKIPIGYWGTPTWECLGTYFYKKTFIAISGIHYYKMPNWDLPGYKIKVPEIIIKQYDLEFTWTW